MAIIIVTSCGRQGERAMEKNNSQSEVKPVGSESLSTIVDEQRNEASESEIFALDTAITLKVYGSKREAVLKKLEDKIKELD